MADLAKIQAEAAKAKEKLEKLNLRLLKAKKVNVKTLKVEEAVLRQVKSGKFAWTGKAVDPKSGIHYTISAVASNAVPATEKAS